MREQVRWKDVALEGLDEDPTLRLATNLRNVASNLINGINVGSLGGLSELTYDDTHCTANRKER